MCVCVYLSTMIMIKQLTNNSEPECRFLYYLIIVSLDISFTHSLNSYWMQVLVDRCSKKIYLHCFSLCMNIYTYVIITWLFSNLDFYAMILFTAQNQKDFLHMYFWLLRDNLYVTGYSIVEAIKQERKIYPKNIMYHEVTHKEKPFSYLNHTFCLKYVMIILKCIFFT